jgi:hypothetical protein
MTNRELIKNLFDDLKRRYAQARLVPYSRCGSSQRNGPPRARLTVSVKATRAKA